MCCFFHSRTSSGCGLWHPDFCLTGFGEALDEHHHQGLVKSGRGTLEIEKFGRHLEEQYIGVFASDGDHLAVLGPLGYPPV